MTDIQALTSEFKQHMQALYGDRLAQVILYGSYARGDAHEESDIDLLVVLKDAEVNRLQTIRDSVPLINDLFFRYHILPSPQVVSEEVLYSSTALFYKNVRREGRPI